jgi:hypothetical protein
MKLATRVFGGIALTIGLAGTARADDSSALTAKIASAASRLSSFVIRTSVLGTTGVSTRMTFVRPLRMKSLTTFGNLTIETYLVDGTVYMHSPMIGWRKMSVTQAKASAQSMNIADTLKSQKVTYLPDRQEDGVVVGAFQIESKLPAMNSTLPAAGPPAATAPATQMTTCTFDKSTYRMQTCTNSLMTMTYSNFNDPANVVELPADAKDAEPLVMPTPETMQSPPSALPSTPSPSPSALAIPSPSATASPVS